MPAAEFFNKFRIFSEKNFLDQEFCNLLCDEMSKAPQSNTTSFDSNGAGLIEDVEYTKRKDVLTLPNEILKKLEKKLIGKIPELEEQFGIEINGLQQITPSIYSTGDYAGPHTDNPPIADVPEYIRNRKASIVIFLNEESIVEKEGAYCGGNLTFYGLIEGKTFQNVGMPVVGEAGMLIAFPPNRTHQVTKVTAGKRYVIVSFYD